MNAQGRSQRPGTNAPREGSAARSALSRRDDELRTPPFIRFGRAEEAAREAEQREAAKRAVARQAQLNAYEAEMERMRQASSVPSGSAIPNIGGDLRAASGDSYGAYGSFGYAEGSSAYAQQSAAAPRRKYPAPYASGGAGGAASPSVNNRQRLNRTASTSAALRSSVGAGASSVASARGARRRARRRIPLLFFCLPLIAFALIRTIMFGASVEAVVRGSAQGSAALNQFIMDNRFELTTVAQGSAWSALRWFFISLASGFVLNGLAWYYSGKRMALLAAFCYALAALAAPWRNCAPTIALAILPSLTFNALSFYALSISRQPRRNVSRRRPPRGRSVSGGARA